jgi:hypothetical protein
MTDDFITPDFVEQQNSKPRSSNTRQAPMQENRQMHVNNQENQTQSIHGDNRSSNFFQENKVMIIIGAVALVVILVVVFWIMTREKKPDLSKRPPPGNQNMPSPGYNVLNQGPPRGPPPGYGVPNTPPIPAGVPSQYTPPVGTLEPVSNPAKKQSKPTVVQQESVIETADDTEVNRYMNIGTNDDDPISSEDNDEVQKKDNVDGGNFTNLDQYDSDGDD